MAAGSPLCNKVNIPLVSAWVCLLLGTSIYLLFRCREYLGFIILDAIGLSSATDHLRSMTTGVHLQDFILYNLPDGLWSASYILFSNHINKHKSPTTRLTLASIVPVIGITTELLQLTPLISGTFDPLDIVCYATPLIIYIKCNHFHKLS